MPATAAMPPCREAAPEVDPPVAAALAAVPAGVAALEAPRLMVLTPWDALEEVAAAAEEDRLLVLAAVVARL